MAGNNGTNCYRSNLPIMLLAVTALAFFSLYIHEITSKGPMPGDNSLLKEEEELLKRTSILENASSEGWRYFNNSLYYVSDESESWYLSKQSCLEKGAHLLIINSPEEQDFLLKVVRRRRLDKVWIGSSNVGQEHLSTRAQGDHATSPPLKTGCSMLQPFDKAPVKEVNGGRCDTHSSYICEKLMEA